MAPSFDNLDSATPVACPIKQTFDRAVLDLSDEPAEGSIQSLPDLIQFNAVQNPEHVFAIQQTKLDQGHHLQPVTFRALHHAISRCRDWIASHCTLDGTKPVGLFMESDLGLFIYLSTLLSLEIPVLLLSARLGPAALGHLITQTGATSILVSKRTASPASQGTVDSPVQLVHALPFAEFLTPSTPTDIQPLPRVPSSDDKPGSLILHSSGSTGLPKPVFLTHRYVLGYAACHRLRPEESVGRVNVSTLPLYHGFGLLAPCLSLSVGKPCCLPSPSTIPSATSTIELLQSVQASSLMTVPSIIEGTEYITDAASLKTLQALDFVAIGGGAIKPDIGEKLHRQGVSLLNHYGATEIGAIAHIFIPDATYDWRYLRLRSDLGLRVEDAGAENSLHCKLVGYPFGWQRTFEVQDLLERNPVAVDDIEVKILARKDDVVVLATGEKVLPQVLEQALNATAGVKTAVVFGEKRETVGVLIEPQEAIPVSAYQGLVDKIWPCIDQVNQRVDRHARVLSPDAVVIVPEGKAIPRSDKGSVMRNEVARVFSVEIEAAYTTLGQSSQTPHLDSTDPLPGLREIIQSCLGDRVNTAITDDADFFELGMDSLEATRLARQLNSLPNKASFPGIPDTPRPDYIYQHPTLSSLSAAMVDAQPSQPSAERAQRMQSMLQETLQTLRPPAGAVVLLTGSTGALGVHLVDQLASNPHIQRIICLNRPRPGVQDPWTQQQDACRARGVHPPPASTQDDKLTVLHATTHEQNLGLPVEVYARLTASVTHIVHNAWPMDFNRQLSSFRGPIASVRNLIHLAYDIHALRPHVLPRVVFNSSIAVTGRYPAKQVPEEPMTDPTWTVPMGYAEAKWVCEGLLDEAAKASPGVLDAVIIRLGQLSGSTASGFWTKTEHLPTLVSASARIGTLPDIQGTYSWLPVDTASRVVTELTLSKHTERYHHVENPVRQSWPELIAFLRGQLGLAVTGFEDWVRQARQTDRVTGLEAFFEQDFQSLASGPIVLRTEASCAVSRTLRGVGGVGGDVVRKYLASWREQGAL
ncbi:hypothetical protein BDW62DRAFT_203306 [Aspergillus aurantiobrunneus]